MNQNKPIKSEVFRAVQSEFTENPSKFITPATYSIEIEGLLDESWSERLAGMNVKTIKRNTLALVTILSGPLRDQAELLGVLKALYSLRLTLIAVRRQNEPLARK